MGACVFSRSCPLRGNKCTKNALSKRYEIRRPGPGTIIKSIDTVFMKSRKLEARLRMLSLRPNSSNQKLYEAICMRLSDSIKTNGPCVHVCTILDGDVYKPPSSVPLHSHSTSIANLAFSKMATNPYYVVLCVSSGIPLLPRHVFLCLLRVSESEKPGRTR
jgi:hypothetical protein